MWFFIRINTYCHYSIIQEVLLLVYSYCLVWSVEGDADNSFTSGVVLCHVLLQVNLLNCPERTKVTRKWLLPSVDAYVGLKICFLSRSVRAVGTCKWLFASVWTDVVHHGGHLGHGAVTVGTFVAGCLSAAGGVTWFHSHYSTARHRRLAADRHL